MNAAATETIELRNSIKRRLMNIHGFWFHDTRPMTGRDKRDDDVINSLHAENKAPSGPEAARQRLTRLMLESNCSWDILVAKGPKSLWARVGRASNGSLPRSIVRDLVLAFVRARGRFLRRFPRKDPHDVDNMLAAYAQHLLEKFQELKQKVIRGLHVHWYLSEKDIQAVESIKPQGPARQLSRNKFELSESARNMLVPVRCLSPIGKFKGNLMGMAEEEIQNLLTVRRDEQL
ncbi:hypothetical protein ISF_01714 [Cordyceps fumosorosea ARSEF 2679]|uniref:Uncharacterized protein n=1 Tax=Cordyceps fumosorosea (strain ARSEF 2679) TaxID=1081104 RepID=A0A168CAS7_CORFA|nr:hypothetical protein ISF_01714 [Cordyceps fumosorosea ARSEF 2679]OAA71163.1 hypothetical protein ISF_01714 [Cordyceps fumosorosea ARSEF 2679]